MKALRGRWWAAWVALSLWGCGDGGGGIDVECRSAECPNPDGGGTPAPPPAGTQPLWLLTAKSTWTYRISADPYNPPSEKTVEVEGEATIPETGGSAIRVRSVQPHLTEVSYQREVNGIVMRLREEDYRTSDGGALRVMTWGETGTVKTIGAPRELDWGFSSTVLERIRYFDGTPEETKEKTYAWKVVGVDVEVTVPAGTFKTVQLLRERTDKDDKVDRYYWLAPGVGKVKETGERTEELVHYDVKP